uniref:Uncharacterized protein n=1 Tax=Pararge aegeria TaxID=116150 RepID=S4P6U5_9NEOP
MILKWQYYANKHLFITNSWTICISVLVFSSNFGRAGKNVYLALCLFNLFSFAVFNNVSLVVFNNGFAVNN